MKKLPPAIEIMRQEWLLRDDRDCVPCRIIGYCDPHGRGWCQGNRLVSPDLEPAVYWKLDALRREQAHLRLHLGHVNGKGNETWRDGCGQCSCHNLGQTRQIREVCLEYTAQFPETGTDRFEEAALRRPAEKDAMRASFKKASQTKYLRDKKKAGGSPLSKMKGKSAALKTKPQAASSKLPQKILDQQARPVLNGGSIS